MTLSAPNSQTVTVNYAMQFGSAIAGTDYTPVSGTLSFPPNSIIGQPSPSPSSTITAPARSPQTFTLTLSSPSNATLGAKAHHHQYSGRHRHPPLPRPHRRPPPHRRPRPHLLPRRRSIHVADVQRQRKRWHGDHCGASERSIGPARVGAICHHPRRQRHRRHRLQSASGTLNFRATVCRLHRAHPRR